jgi:expansin (peptidoglycan-binding protein)
MTRHVVLVSSAIVGLVLVACATENESPQRLRRGASGSAASEGPGNADPTNETGATGPQPSGQPSTAKPLGEVKQGTATFYDADGTGNCSYSASQDRMVVAPHKERIYDGSGACGACFKVTGQKGSVVVRVVDSCPVNTAANDCGDTNADLDLSAEAFAAIEDPNVGIANVSYQLVPCEVVGPMKFRFKDGSSQWWTAVQVLNHREPVAKVEYSRDGGWVEMTREDDNFFVEPDGVGPRPQGLPLRITSKAGHVVLETLPIDDSTTLTGQHQFD